MSNPFDGTVNCEQCNQCFIPRTKRQRFCTSLCRNEWQRLDTERRAKKRAEDATKPNACRWCGGEYFTSTGRAYCSAACQRDRNKYAVNAGRGFTHQTSNHAFNVIVEAELDILRGEVLRLLEQERRRSGADLCCGMEDGIQWYGWQDLKHWIQQFEEMHADR